MAVGKELNNNEKLSLAESLRRTQSAFFLINDGGISARLDEVKFTDESDAMASRLCNSPVNCSTCSFNESCAVRCSCAYMTKRGIGIVDDDELLKTKTTQIGVTMQSLQSDLERIILAGIPKGFTANEEARVYGAFVKNVRLLAILVFRLARRRAAKLLEFIAINYNVGNVAAKEIGKLVHTLEQPYNPDALIEGWDKK